MLVGFTEPVETNFTGTELPEPLPFLILDLFTSLLYSALYLSLNVINSSIDILDKDLPAKENDDWSIVALPSITASIASKTFLAWLLKSLFVSNYHKQI